MGTVWRATDELLDRTVALKQLRLEGLDLTATETARQRVLREARTIARLHHPHAVTIFDVVIEGTEPWLVLEYVPSQSLADRMRESGPLDPDEAARVGRAVADALAAAHEHGIIHRDVKPANILLGASGAVKLTDFGISRTIGDLSLTASGMMIGTPAYLAPEVAAGMAATPASDVFGLGATLYAAVEGVPPFGTGDDGNVLLLLRRAAEGQVPPPQRAGRLTDLLMRLLDPDPSRRPLAAEVMGLLASPAPQVPSIAPAEPTRTPLIMPAEPTLTGPDPNVPAPRRPRRPWLLVGATVLTVAAIVAALLVAIMPAERAAGPVPSAAPVAIDRCDKSRGELVIGMITSLTGEYNSLGKGMRNAAQLAVDRANEDCTVPGYRLAFRPVDDKATEADAASAATALAADPAVVGVVGTLMNKAAQGSQPVLANAGVVQISPANTGPSLTRGTGADASRPFPGYFRIIGNDAKEGDAAAAWMIRNEGRRAFAVVDDGSTYGTAMSSEVTFRAGRSGARVVLRERVDGAATDFSAVVARIAAAKPDAVFYGGDHPASERLSQQLAAAGLNVPLVGGTGMFTGGDPYRGREGDLVVSSGAPLSLMPTAGQFASAYEDARLADGAGAYGAFSYDATTVLATALGRVTADGGWAPDRRHALIDAVQNMTLSGATGTISFDAFGDNAQPVYTVYHAVGGRFDERGAVTIT